MAALIRLAASILAATPAIARAETRPESPTANPAVEYQVPEGFSLSLKRAARPGGGVVAFLVPELWCAADARREIAASRRLGAFDAEGRLLWDAKAYGLLEIKEMFVQRDGAVIVWGWHLERAEGAHRSSVLVRYGRGGLDRSFQALTPADLGGLSLTSVTLGSDDGVDIEGSFTSVRGQPRPGRARLSADGALED
jgi:hypothetical protein